MYDIMMNDDHFNGGGPMKSEHVIMALGRLPVNMAEYWRMEAELAEYTVHIRVDPSPSYRKAFELKVSFLRKAMEEKSKDIETDLATIAGAARCEQ